MEATIVLYPAPGISHILSMVELAKHIVRHQPRHSITILLTTGFLDHPSIDSYVQRISTSNLSISFLRFPHAAAPAVGNCFAATFFQFVKTNAPNVRSTLHEISKSRIIKALVIDLFCMTAMEEPYSMGIPVNYFFTSGAVVLALLSYFPKLHQQTTVSFKDMADVELQIPGNAALKAPQMPEPILDREDPAYWDMVYFCKHLPKANGIVVNTF
ncbi:glycosyltransferase GT19J14 [Sesbania bispinosa]|nr:glycosyltransferase GT19J14 [Sesbania bispinosa]